MPKPNQAVVRVELRYITHDEWEDFGILADSLCRSSSNAICCMIKAAIRGDIHTEQWKNPGNNQTFTKNAENFNTNLRNSSSRAISSNVSAENSKVSTEIPKPSNLPLKRWTEEEEEQAYSKGLAPRDMSQQPPDVASGSGITKWENLAEEVQHRIWDSYEIRFHERKLNIQTMKDRGTL